MMIEIDSLKKSYGGAPALDEFGLRVEEGEAVGLVGPNGAGKTTLIKILATLIRPNGGSARIAGHDVTLEPRAMRALAGYMPDVPGLYQDMRVAEFLEFFADAFRLKAERKRVAVARALELAGLSDRRAMYVEQLSLGLKQRLVLAKTLLHEPRVLLLDEPATGLDPMHRIELREQLRKFHREGVTILISSHILSDLEDICTRVALIAAGRNAADAEGRTVLNLEQPKTAILTCEVEVLGEAQSAAEVAASHPGARVVKIEDARLFVEVTGGRLQAAALLKHLVGAEVKVVRFDARGLALEDRYRKAFGASPA